MGRAQVPEQRFAPVVSAIRHFHGMGANRSNAVGGQPIHGPAERVVPAEVRRNKHRIFLDGSRVGKVRVVVQATTLLPPGRALHHKVSDARQITHL